MRGPARTVKGKDGRRTARLMCAADPAGVQIEAMKLRESRLRGLAAKALAKAGADHVSVAVEPVVRARRTVLGDAAQGEPLVLIRVDEFPHARARDHPGRYGTESFARFHEVLAEADVPYLLALLPRVARDYLNPEGGLGDPLDQAERRMLEELMSDRVCFGLHGHTHRTRDRRPRHRTALGGMDAAALNTALNSAHDSLRELGIEPSVFVPPFNRFDRTQWDLLAQRYEVICGGPESAQAMGLRLSPRWIGEAVYLPSYPPLYDRARNVAAAIQRLADAQAAVWAPVTLHVGWELDEGLHGLRRFARLVAPYARPWPAFLSAVAGSRQAV